MSRMGWSFTILRACLRDACLAWAISCICGVSHAEYNTSPNDTLLYNPAYVVEGGADGVVLRGKRFTYVFRSETEEWEVQREDNRQHPELTPQEPYLYRGSMGEWCFRGVLEEEKGILRCWRGVDTLSNPLWEMTLWDVRTLEREWNVSQGHFFVSRPHVGGVAELDGLVWIAIAFYVGEEFRGLGTLVRFDTSMKSSPTIVRPRELAASSLGPLTAADGALWLGTALHGEFRTYRDKGLARFDPVDLSVRFWPPSTDPTGGDIITALHGTTDELWFATDAGMGRLRFADQRWERWRIVPSLHLTQSTPVHSHPLLPPRGRLPAGQYEVRWVDPWVHVGWIELVTPDLAVGLTTQAATEVLAFREYDVAPICLTTQIAGGPEPVTLNSMSDTEPAAYLIRVRLRPTGRSRVEGGVPWIEVCAHAGWIAPDEHEIEMRVERDRVETEAPQEEEIPTEMRD